MGGLTVHLDGPMTVAAQMAEREEGGSENWAAEAISVAALDPGATDPTCTETGAGPLRGPGPGGTPARINTTKVSATSIRGGQVLSVYCTVQQSPPSAPSVTTGQPDQGSHFIHVGV